MKKLFPYFSYTFLILLLSAIVVANLLKEWDRREAKGIGLTAISLTRNPKR